MTTPLIVITMEGGVIQDISVSLQARVVVVDYDKDDYDISLQKVLAGHVAGVVDHGTLMPSPDTAGWLKQVLLCLKA